MARPTTRDRTIYTEALARLAPLSPAELAAGLALVRVRTLRRGEAFLRVGAPATDVAVVVEGLLRELFVLPRGIERTKAFVIEGELSGSLADLLSGAPSRAAIVAEEPTRLLVAPYAAYRALGERFAGWARVGRAATERLLVQKAEREHELLGLDAEARYRAFAARYPGLEARAKAKHVASYLGITPVHLSRLRRRRREEARRAASTR